MKRRHLMSAGVVLVVVVAVVGYFRLRSGPTLHDAAALNSALPVEKDLSGFVASGGIEGALSSPPGIQMGRIALTGDKLAAQCRRYASQGTDWACDGLTGLGTVGFEDAQNVYSRVSSFVLAYDHGGAAETAWSKLVDATRAYLRGAHQGSGPVEGDESRAFTSVVGTTLVVRAGSVVILEMSNYEFGYDTGSDTTLPLGYAHPADPIRRWANVQTRKVTDALAAA